MARKKSDAENAVLTICVLRNQLKYFVVLLALFNIHSNIQGQMIFDTLQLSELEILAKKIDYNKTVKQNTIDTLVKQETNHLSLGELLSTYTPVFVKTYGRGALSTVSFRGTSATHTQVYWNDFLINSPMLGQVDFSLIPNSFVDEVELFYGGGSLIKSSGALGGGVSLNNKHGFDDRPLLVVEQTLGSYGFISTALGLKLGNEKFSSLTRFSYQKSQNDFMYLNTALSPPVEMRQQNAEYDNIGFTQQFSYKPAKNQRITFLTWNQWNKRNIPPLMTNVEDGIDQNENQKDNSSRNTLSWVYYKNKSRIEVKGAYFFTDMNYILETPDDQNGISDTTINSQNKTNTISGKIKYDQSLRHGISLSAGFDLDAEQINTNNYDGIQQRNTSSLYGLVIKDFRNRLKLSLLIRGVLIDGEMLPLLPLFGLNYKILKREDLYLRANVSKNYHVPTLNDLYWDPGGNPDLNHEEAIETEVGLNYKKVFSGVLSLDFDASVFASKVSNWIQWIPSQYGYWSPQNVNEVFARGFEFSTSINSQKRRFIYKILLQYAYTRTTNESQYAVEQGYSGNQLLYIPEHTGVVYLYGSYSGYFANWTLSYVGERNTSLNPDSGSNSKLPAILLNNISVGKKFIWNRTNLNLRFAVNNVFDVDYQAVQWRAMPGRNYEITLKFELDRNKKNKK